MSNKPHDNIVFDLTMQPSTEKDCFCNETSRFIQADFEKQQFNSQPSPQGHAGLSCTSVAGPAKH